MYSPPGMTEKEGRLRVLAARDDEIIKAPCSVNLEVLAIHVFPMSNFDNEDDEFIVFNAVYDPVLSLSQPIPVMTGQFLTSMRTWINGELFDFLHNKLTIFFARDGFNFLYS